MIISIDHGNKQVKTVHAEPFTSGCITSEHNPKFGGDTICFDGMYYTLSERRINYMRDKTTDDRFFVLTLFAIANEIEANNAYTDNIINIDLLVGLPPTHYGSQFESFRKYFLRDGIAFEKNGKDYYIQIRDVHVYPQGVAALINIYNEIRDAAKTTLIDIGGYTAIYMVYHNGKIDMSACDSLEKGIIRLYNTIKKKVDGDFQTHLSESEIDSIIRGEDTDVPEDIVQTVHSEARLFIKDLINQLREEEIDLKTGKTIFTGGGAILLQEYIKECGDMISNPIFIADIKANAKGYEILYQADK